MRIEIPDELAAKFLEGQEVNGGDLVEAIGQIVNTRQDEYQSKDWKAYVSAAQRLWGDDVSVDDDALVSPGEDDGAYVQAWVWMAGTPCSDEECTNLVDDGDPYHGTPCGTFCEDCMENKHAKECAICDAEFELDAFEGEKESGGD